MIGELVGGGIVPLVSSFSWFQLLPGFGHGDHLATSIGLPDQEALVVIATSWFVVAGVLAFALVARAQLRATLARPGAEKYAADPRLTARTLGEVLVEGLRDLIGSTLTPKDTLVFFPLLASIFTYIFANNLVGFIPGMVPATESVSSNVGLAVLVFVVFNVAGLMRNGTGYVKHLAGPKLAIWLLPITALLFVIEAFSLLIRPGTLTIRLSANMFADHLVSGLMRDIGSGLGVLGPVAAVLLPLPFYALGLLVCFLQAFVFTLLSTIYIGLAVAHDEGHH